VDAQPVDVNFLPSSPVLAQLPAFQPSSPAASPPFSPVLLPLALLLPSAYCCLQNERSPWLHLHH
jgi:hypothetical protein